MSGRYTERTENVGENLREQAEDTMGRSTGRGDEEYTTSSTQRRGEGISRSADDTLGQSQSQSTTEGMGRTGGDTMGGDTMGRDTLGSSREDTGMMGSSTQQRTTGTTGRGESDLGAMGTQERSDPITGRSGGRDDPMSRSGKDDTLGSTGTTRSGRDDPMSGGTTRSDPTTGMGTQRTTRSEGGGLGAVSGMESGRRDDDSYGSSYAGSGQQAQEGQGKDSKIGKFVEKAGGILGSKNMEEKGAAKREKEASDDM